MSTAVKEKEDRKAMPGKTFNGEMMDRFQGLWGMNFHNSLNGGPHEFYKNYFATQIKAINMWGEFTFQMLDTMMDTTMHLQKEGQKVFKAHIDRQQSMFEEFQKMSKENIENLFSTIQ